MFASTSKTLLKSAVTRAAPRRLLSTPTLSPDTLPVSPPTTDLPASPLPAQYRSTNPAANSIAPSSSSRYDAAPTRARSSMFGSAPALRHVYKLHVFATRNNTILTLTTSPNQPQNSYHSSFLTAPSPPASQLASSQHSEDAHHPVCWQSAGSSGYKGAARGSYDAAVETTLRMFAKIRELMDPTVGSGGQRKKVVWARPTELEVVWKGFGQGRDAVYRTLMGGEGDGVRNIVRTVTDAVRGSFWVTSLRALAKHTERGVSQ